MLYKTMVFQAFLIENEGLVALSSVSISLLSTSMPLVIDDEFSH